MLKKFALLACLVSTCALAATPAASDVEIVSAEFGLFDASTPGELAFQPTTVVPHVVGQRYGWIIELRTKRRSVEVIEEYLLANAADAPTPTDPVLASLAVAAPRRNQVSQRQLVPVEGRIYGEWGIGAGEPAGVRQLQVSVEGRVAASFRYEVK